MGLFDFLFQKKLTKREQELLDKYSFISFEPKQGFIRVSTSRFDEMTSKYQSNVLNDFYMFFGINKQYIYIDKDFYEKAVNYDITENKRLKDLFELQNKTAELNNKGIKYEKEGNIEKAIETYEKNVSLGYTATHSYDRLCIIYRKQKDYENEIRIINLFLTNFPNTKTFEKSIDKYKTRLSKATELLTKSYKQ